LGKSYITRGCYDIGGVKMKNIVGILICMLMITTIFPVIGTNNIGYENSYDIFSSESIVPEFSYDNEIYAGESELYFKNEMMNRNVYETLNEVIDQDFSDLINFGLIFSNEYPKAQSFMPSLEILSKIEIPFFAKGQPPENSKITMSLKSDLESDEVLTSMTIDANQITDIPLWITFDFEDISVVPETKYYIICESTTEELNDNYGQCLFER